MIASLSTRLSTLLATGLAVAIAVGAASPAGPSTPSRIRMATIEGMRGPVYYSIAEGRFLSIVPLDARMTAEPELIAGNVR